MGNEALRVEADHLKIDISGKELEEVRKLVSEQWLQNLRQSLQDNGVDDSRVQDKDIESFYNFFLAMKSMGVFLFDLQAFSQFAYVRL